MIVLSNYNIKAEYPMFVVIVLMAVLTHYTAIVRMVIIFKEIRRIKKHAG